MIFFFAKFEPQNQKISCVYVHSSPNVDKIPVLAVYSQGSEEVTSCLNWL
jgi:hypothetical protein